MAIYIGIKLIDEDTNTKYYSFSNSAEEEYGVLAIDTTNGEIELIQISNEQGIPFAFPRAKKALVKHFEAGELPNQFCYAT